MSLKYHIQLSYDLAKAIDEIGHLVKVVNDVYSQYGVGGSLIVRGQNLSMGLTVDRKLKRKELNMIKNVLGEKLNEHFPKLGFRVDSIRRQSSKSHSQSQSR